MREPVRDKYHIITRKYSLQIKTNECQNHLSVFCHLTALCSEYLAIDHKVGTVITLAASKHTHAYDYTHHCDA